MAESHFVRRVPSNYQMLPNAENLEKLKEICAEQDERRYRTLESAATRLQKESKGYLDSLRGM